MARTLREYYQPIIARVLAEHKDQPRKEVHAALRAAFPHPPRAYWRYKVWLDEIAQQTGEKKRRPRLPEPVHPGQLALFETEDDDESET